MSRIFLTAETAGGPRTWIQCSFPLGLLCRSLLWSVLAVAEVGNNFTFARVSAVIKHFLWSLFISSLAYAATSLADFVGHSSTGHFRNSGSFCHTESPLRSSRVAPLVLRSAMLCSPGIDLQSSMDMNFWISPTLFAKKVSIAVSLDCSWHSLAVQQMEPTFNLDLTVFLDVSSESCSEDSTTDLRLHWFSLLVEWCELCFGLNKPDQDALFGFPSEVCKSSIALATSIRECYSPGSSNPIDWCEASVEGYLVEVCVFLKQVDSFSSQSFRQRFVPCISGQNFTSSFLKSSSDKNGSFLFDSFGSYKLATWLSRCLLVSGF